MWMKALCASPLISLARASEPAPRHHPGPPWESAGCPGADDRIDGCRAQEGDHVFPRHPRVGGNDVGTVLGCGNGRGDDRSSRADRHLGIDRKVLPKFSRQQDGQILQSLLRHAGMNHQYAG
jgi:hypothetical protein